MSVESVKAAMAVVLSASSENAARAQAQAFLDDQKHGPSSSQLAVTILTEPPSADTTALSHFALQILREIVRSNWSTLSAPERAGIKDGLLAIFAERSHSFPSAVLHKLVDVICEVAVRDWPQAWPALFTTPAAPRWLVAVAARISEICSSETSGIVLAPGRQKALVAGLANALPSLLNVGSQLASSSSENAATCISLFAGLTEVFRRSDFLLRIQVDRFLLGALSDENLRFEALAAISSLALNLDGRRAVPLTAVSTEITDSDIARITDAVAQFTIHALSNSDKYMKDESYREVCRALAATAIDVTTGCGGTVFRPKLLEAAFFMCLHPSVEIAHYGAMGVEFAVKKHRGALVPNFQLDIWKAALIVAHKPGLSTGVSIDLHSALLNRDARNHRKFAAKLAEIEPEETGTESSHVFGKTKSIAVSIVKQLRADTAWVRDCVLSQWLPSAISDSESYSALLVLVEAASTIELGGAHAAAISGLVSGVLSQQPPVSGVQISESPAENSMRSYFSLVTGVSKIMTADDCRGVLGLIFAETRDVIPPTNSMQITDCSFLAEWYRPAQNSLLAICRNSGSSLLPVLPILRERLLVQPLRPWAVEALLLAFAAVPPGSEYQQTLADCNALFDFARQQLEKSIFDASPGDAHRAVSLVSSMLGGPNKEEFGKFVLTSLIAPLWKTLANVPITQVEWDIIFGTDEGKRQRFTGSDSILNRQWFHLFTSTCNLIAKCAGLCSSTSILGPVTLMVLETNLRPSLLEISAKHALLPIARVNTPLGVQPIVSTLTRLLATEWRRIAQSSNDHLFEHTALTRASATLLNIVAATLSVDDQEEISAASVMQDSPDAGRMAYNARKAKRTKNRFAGLDQEDVPSTSGTLSFPLDSNARSVLMAALCTAFTWPEAVIRALGIFPSVALRCWSGASQGGLNPAIEFLQASLIPSLQSLTALAKELPQKAATLGAGRLHDFITEKVISSTVTQPSDFVEKLTVAFQSVLVIGLSLFEAQANSQGMAANVENAGVSSELGSIAQIILQVAGDGEESRKLLAMVVNQKAAKSAKPAIKSLVQRIVGGKSEISSIVAETAEDRAVGTVGSIDRTSEEVTAAEVARAMFS